MVPAAVTATDRLHGNCGHHNVTGRMRQRPWHRQGVDKSGDPGNLPMTNDQRAATYEHHHLRIVEKASLHVSLLK